MPKKKKSTIQKIGAGGLLLMLGLFTGMVLLHGLADIGLQATRAFVSVWHSQPAAEEWQKASKPLRWAAAIDVLNPAIMEQWGHLHEWRVYGEPFYEPEVNKAQQQALLYYRRAAQMRPSWPYAWMNIAVLKYRMRQMDAEFQQAIARAVRLGSWEPDIQRRVAEVGLAAWLALPTKTKAQVMAIIKQGMRQQPDTLFMISRRYARLSLVCSEMGLFDSRRKYCDQFD